MKKQTTLRDQLYATMDRLINHAISIEKKLPAISLSSDQFQIFQDFNDPNFDGHYSYRGSQVRQK